MRSARNQPAPPSATELFWTALYGSIFTLGLIEATKKASSHILNQALPITKCLTCTEWLINYQGGFIRRGLPGEVLFQTASHLNINGRMALVTVPLGALAVLLLYSWRRFANILPKWIIFTPAFLLFPILDPWAGSLFRKDIILALGLACFIRFAKSRRAKDCLTANIIAVICTLTHEAFFFYAFGSVAAISFLQANYSQARPSIPIARRLLDAILNSLKRFISDLSPLLLAMLAATANRGNFVTASAILASLQQIPHFQNPGLEPTGSLEALSWSSEKVRSLFLQMLFTRNKHIPVFVGVFSTALAGAMITAIAIFNHPYPSPSLKAHQLRKTSKYIAIAAIVALFSLPLYYLGIDYGRWIFLAQLTSIFVFVETEAAEAKSCPDAQPGSKTIQPKKQITASIAPFVMLFYGICPIGWELHTAIGYAPSFWLRRNLQQLLNIG